MHQRQLDPTQIVVIPYDLNRLFLFVACTVFARGVLQPHRYSLARQLLRLGTDSGVAVATMVLCGASPTRDVAHTVCAAVYLVLLATTDPPSLPPATSAAATAPRSPTAGGERPTSLSLLQRLAQPLPLCPRCDEGPGRRSCDSIVAHCVVGLNIPFSILRLYDRGWQWQRWPIPVVVASTYGWVLGTILGLVLAAVRKPTSTSAASLMRDE